MKNIENAASTRLDEELKQGKIAIQNGDSISVQKEIITTWQDWYLKAANTTSDMVSNIELFNSEIEKTQTAIKTKVKSVLEELEK